MATPQVQIASPQQCSPHVSGFFPDCGSNAAITRHDLENAEKLARNAGNWRRKMKQRTPYSFRIRTGCGGTQGLFRRSAQTRA
jgi:hypothetical protein